MTNSLRHTDLLASCWTSAGNAVPMSDNDHSPIEVRTRVEAIARGGWKGFGLWHSDLITARETIGWKELRRIIDANGIEYIELEFLTDWWTTGHRRAQSDVLRAELFRAAEVLGAKTLKVGSEIGGDAVDDEAFHNEFDELASQAGRAGLRVAIEPMPMSNLNTIEAGVEFIKAVGNPHGGLTVDTWHTFRGRTPYSSLPELLPIDQVFIVELDDGDRDVVGTLWEDTVNNRRLCGEGDFDLPEFIVAMHDAGWSGPWGVEIISHAHRALPLDEGLAAAYRTATAAFDAAAETVAARGSAERA
jgi:sugar phosphate isomerase/epimerase